MQKIAKLIATVFFVGFCPIAPGTAASLLALPIYYFLRESPYVYLLITIGLLVVGFWSSSRAEKEFGRKDPGEIVIDEFSAMLIVFLFSPFQVKFMVIGFFLFRIFDILKFPALKRLERLPKGYGIMLDDIAAAILANLVLQVIRII